MLLDENHESGRTQPNKTYPFWGMTQGGYLCPRVVCWHTQTNKPTHFWVWHEEGICVPELYVGVPNPTNLPIFGYDSRRVPVSRSCMLVYPTQQTYPFLGMTRGGYLRPWVACCEWRSLLAGWCWLSRDQGASPAARRPARTRNIWRHSPAGDSVTSSCFSCGERQKGAKSVSLWWKPDGTLKHPEIEIKIVAKVVNAWLWSGDFCCKAQDVFCNRTIQCVGK